MENHFKVSQASHITIYWKNNILKMKTKDYSRKINIQNDVMTASFDVNVELNDIFLSAVLKEKKNSDIILKSH